MGNSVTLTKLSVVVFCYLVDYVCAQHRVQGCIEGQNGCRRCRGEMCARCAILLHHGTCVDACPPGHIAGWSTKDEYMGRICQETGYMFGLTGSQVAIFIGVVSGAVICIFIILCGAIVVHRRKKKAANMIRQFEDSTERKEFLKHLAILRTEGSTFLSMLNDTRRQVRELYYSSNNGDRAAGVQAYRPVLRDLVRILVLVNKKDDEILIPPEDWQRLMSWAERLLRRYKKHNSSEVSQLVTFLQQPKSCLQVNTSQSITITQSSASFEPRTTPNNLTTFQANIPLATFQASDKSSISPASSSLGYAKDSPVGSSIEQHNCCMYNEKVSFNTSTIGQITPLVYGNQKLLNHATSHVQDIALATFNHSYKSTVTLPENNFVLANCNIDSLDREIDTVCETPIEAPNYTILSNWTQDQDYLIDDFTILGFRPQDEITTEL